MSRLCLNVCRLCVSNIMSLGICFFFLNAPRQSWCVCAWYSVKICIILGVVMCVTCSWNFYPRHYSQWSHRQLSNAASLTHSAIWLPFDRQFGGYLDYSVHGAWRSSISLPTTVQQCNWQNGLHFCCSFHVITYSIWRHSQSLSY